ncbi:acyl-CoA-like ligand-binding transcription factor [Streptosporangium soli]|nr:TetR family transcriptional regulator [Streptosporangium sp. KLBMP 9127]
MSQLPHTAPSAPGAWERKRARAKTAIQRQALRLFREQGYHATTVEQVAEAADVAPSTVFRYFPTKHDLAVLDDFYPLSTPVTEAFRAQPAELSVLRAFREALRAAFEALSPADREARFERDLVLLTVPELLAANFGTIDRAIDVLSALVAERTGRDPGDGAVRSLTRAVCGVALAALFEAAHNPDLDLVEQVDRALADLETGLTL